jgi:alkaline phosphatase D
MTPPLDRRAFLRLTSAAAVAGPGLLAACAEDLEPPLPPSTCDDVIDDQGEPWAEDPEQVLLDAEQFPLPPQAGAMREHAALLWGYAAAAAQLELRVWRMDGDQRVLVHSAQTQTQEGYTKAQVEGLAPGQWYHYAWFTSDEERLSSRSVVGRFRSAFAPGCAAPLRVAATACTHRRFAPYRSLELMAEASPDLFLQLGDMSYNDGARDQAGFRSRWHETLTDPGYVALLAQCGMYVTWDDHEIVDSGTYYNIAEERRRMGTECWFETLPTPRLGGDRFWDRYRWGDTAEFFILDCRSERQPDTRATPDAAYLSRAQMDWFKAALKESTAQWKVVVNSVPMTNWPEAMIMENDRWEGYQAQRQELVDYITEEGIEGVLIVAGDFHCGGVARLEPEGPASRIFEVLAGPGANGGNPMAFLWQQGSEPERERMFAPGQFQFLSHEMSTTLLDFDPAEGRVQVTFTNPEDEAVRYQAYLYLDGRVEVLA